MRTATPVISSLCIVWASLVCLVPHAVAQSGTATINGIVRDATNVIVPGVTVVARHVQTNSSSSAETDVQGRYELRNLPAGDFEIRATLPGFQPAAVTVTVGGGDTRTVDLTLEPAGLFETITVTRADQAPVTVPQAVTVVAEEAVQFAQRRDLLSESLRGTPGLFAENRRNYSLSGGVNAAIRAPMMGFDMRGIQILQDGIPLTTADGTTQPTNLDLGSAGRIEVLRGPSSVLYGNSAGGVISVWTEFPSNTPLSIEPDIQFGSHGYQRQQVKVEGTSGRTSYLANINRMKVDGFRLNSGAEVRRANVMVRHAVSPATEIRGVFNFFDMPFGESASTLTLGDARNVPTSVRGLAFTQGWGEDATQGQGGVTLQHALGDGHLIRTTGWGQWRSVWNPIPFRIIDLGRKAGGARTEYSGEGRLGTVPVGWTTGVDFSYQHDDRMEFRNAGVPAGGTRTRQGAQILAQLEEVFSAAPFAQVRFTFEERWHLTGGVRYDYYDFSATDRFLSDGDQSGGRTLDAVSPMVGLTFASSDALNLYTNFATAYQTPTTVELSNRPSGEGGFNEQLEPEDLRSVEVGARGTLQGQGGEVRYEIALYGSTLDNAFVELQRPDEQTFFANAGKTSRNGLELRVEFTAEPGLDAFVSYTYQDFTFERFSTGSGDLAGNREPGAPPHQLYVGGSYETPFGLQSAVQVRWVDDYAVNNANTAFNWSYQVVDLRFGWDGRLGGVAVQPFVGVENLFDERYNASTIPNAFGRRYYEPAPGREVYGGLTLGLGLP